MKTFSEMTSSSRNNTVFIPVNQRNSNEQDIADIEETLNISHATESMFVIPMR